MEDCIAKKQGNVPMKIKSGDEMFLVETWESVMRGEEKFLQQCRIFR
jgi:hypothetical protein